MVITDNPTLLTWNPKAHQLKMDDGNGDFQPFPICKDLMDENHPVETGHPCISGWLSTG